jgi:hypothetical protein
MHSHENCTAFLHDFLDLVRVDMLVVETPHDANGRRAGRGCAEQVRQKLKRYCRKMDESLDYCITPNPWKPYLISSRTRLPHHT